MENLKTKLGKRIKDLRKSQSFTQEKLAEMVNMDITSLSKIETGRNFPQHDTLVKISKALNVDIKQLFTFKKPSTGEDYISAINKNIEFIKNDKTKLEILYQISAVLIC